MTSSNDKKTIKIAIVAGEKSGDELGAPLMHFLKANHPNIEFIGVGGPRMISEGLNSFFEMSEISVMGIIEPLLNLRRLLKLRKSVKGFLERENPDIFIGIDSPDFNIPVAKFLKNKLDIPTVQYVSPSVWAWRKGRVKSMEKCIDQVLTLFPFEKRAYSDSTIDVCYVGHPLAYSIEVTEEDVKTKTTNTIALLPGSRKSEILSMGDLMIKVAKQLKKINSELAFSLPLADANHLSLFKEEIEDYIHVTIGDSKEVLKTSEIALITSGTATLESALSYTPCVTLYKTNSLSYLIIKPLLMIKNFSLPNLILEEEFLPELLQSKVTDENILNAVHEITDKGIGQYINKFAQIKRTLQAGGPAKAAEEVIKLIKK